MTRGYRFTPARRVALRKAQLASARKRRKAASVRITQHGGITYKTHSQRVPAAAFRHRHYTTAYKKDQLLGFGNTYNGKKNTAEIVDIYVAQSHRGKGVAQQIIKHQAHAVRGRKVSVTGVRTEGGNKLVSRTKIPGATVKAHKKSRMSSAEITANMDSSFGWRSWDHSRQYKKQQMRAHKATVTGKRIKR